MDWTSIAVAVLAMVGTAFGSLAGIRQANKVVELRLDTLEKKVDKHNHLVERVAVAERDLKTAFRLLDDVRETNERTK